MAKKKAAEPAPVAPTMEEFKALEIKETAPVVEVKAPVVETKTSFHKGELKGWVEKAQAAGMTDAKTVAEWVAKESGKQTTTASVYQTMHALKKARGETSGKAAKVREVSMTELVEMAKNLNGKKSEIAEAIDLLTNVARENNMSVPEFIAAFDKLEELRKAFA
jgi:hypothetical protein